MVNGSNYNMPLLEVDGLLIDIISETTTSLILERRAQQEQFMNAPHVADEVAQPAGIPPDLFRRMSQKSVLQTFPDPPPLSELRLQTSRQHRYGDFRGLQRALAQCFQRMTFKVGNDNDSLFDIPLHVLEQEVPELDVVAAMASPTIEVSALATLKRLIKLFGDLNLWGHRLQDLFVRDTGSGMRSRPIPDVSAYDRTPHLARLFTTCSGYVGAALCPLRAGDRIYIIPGCGMPVVLRPSDEIQKDKVFELVGGVVVSGLVHGEAWRGSDDDGMAPRPEIIFLV